MAKHTTRKGEALYFRRAVPGELRSYFGKREIWVPISATEPALIRIEAARLWATSEEHFDQARKVLGQSVPRDPFGIKTEPEQIQVIDGLTGLPATITVRTGSVPEPRGTVINQDGAEIEFTPGKPSKVRATLDWLHPKFKADTGKEGKTEDERAYAIKLLHRVCGSRPIQEYTEDHAYAFRDALLGKEGFEIKVVRGDELEWKAGKKLSPATTRKYLSLISKVYDWASKPPRKWASAKDNPFKKVEVVGSRDHAARADFTQAELRSIFGAVSADDWIPWIALLGGLRLDEICQLRKRDIRQMDEVHYISVNRENGKTLKTDSSVRDVPVHPRLIELGFVEWVEKHAHGDLFDVSGPVYSKRWAKFLDRVGLDDPRYTFHSFRHTFKSLCREAGIAEEIHDAITGHSNGSVGRSYGNRPSVKRMHEELSKIKSPV